MDSLVTVTLTNIEVRKSLPTVLNTIRRSLINRGHVFTTSALGSWFLSSKCEIQNENFSPPWHHRTKFYVLSGVEKIGIRRGQLKIERFHAKVPLKSRYKIDLLLQV